jgi:hypothetical protein
MAFRLMTAILAFDTDAFSCRYGAIDDIKVALNNMQAGGFTVQIDADAFARPRNPAIDNDISIWRGNSSCFAQQPCLQGKLSNVSSIDSVTIAILVFHWDVVAAMQTIDLVGATNYRNRHVGDEVLLNQDKRGPFQIFRKPRLSKASPNKESPNEGTGS